MIRHADDLVLSDLADNRPQSSEITAHAASCQQCRERIESFRELRYEAVLERSRTHSAPDIWPALASLTIYRSEVRRIVLRELWRPFALWLLVAFVLGIVATEAVRQASRQTAALSNRVAPTSSDGGTKALRTLEDVTGRQ